MESVHDDHFTQVFLTKNGRAVRIDFRLLESQPPDATGIVPGHRAWAQEIPGTPFERVLDESIIEIVIEREREGAGTRVTIAQRQKLRGYSRTGGFLLQRATRRKLTQALDGIERALVG